MTVDIDAVVKDIISGYKKSPKFSRYTQPVLLSIEKHEAQGYKIYQDLLLAGTNAEISITRLNSEKRVDGVIYCVTMSKSWQYMGE